MGELCEWSEDEKSFGMEDLPVGKCRDHESKIVGKKDALDLRRTRGHLEALGHTGRDLRGWNRSEGEAVSHRKISQKDPVVEATGCPTERRSLDFSPLSIYGNQYDW